MSSSATHSQSCTPSIPSVMNLIAKGVSTQGRVGPIEGECEMVGAAVGVDEGTCDRMLGGVVGIILGTSLCIKVGGTLL